MSASVENDVSAAVSPLRVGAYELLERIGRGGLGDVHLARHPGGGEVALKLLRDGDVATPMQLRSFERELNAARRLSHPNILPILDDGIHDGAPYYVMPLVRGGSLERKLRAGRLPLREAVALLAQVAHAVQAAHALGVIHRDLKPANVLLNDDGTPVVADFGLARFLNQMTAHTMTGQLMGSVPYMAPEQAAGRSHTASPATDVWALGVMLYELLFGERPFRGETQTDVLHRIQYDEPATPAQLSPDVPAELEQICLRCVRKRPRDRYAAAGHLAADLDRWLAEEQVAVSRSANEPFCAPSRKDLRIQSGSRQDAQSAAFGADLREAQNDVLLLAQQTIDRLAGTLIFTASGLLVRARVRPDAIAERLGLSRDDVLRKAEELAAALKPHLSPDLLEIPRLMRVKYGAKLPDESG